MRIFNFKFVILIVASSLFGCSSKSQLKSEINELQFSKEIAAFQDSDAQGNEITTRVNEEIRGDERILRAKITTNGQTVESIHNLPGTNFYIEIPVLNRFRDDGNKDEVVTTEEYKASVEAFNQNIKKAADYEQALSKSLNQNLSKYISADRFYVSVRIYWNPEMIENTKVESSTLSPKRRKLPGFPIFLSEEEQSLNYFLGTQNVMKLQVNVLLDKTLPESFVNFVKQFIPVQARFVPERGDYLRIIPIEFPEFVPSKIKDSTTDEIPVAKGELASSDYQTLQDISQTKDEEPTIIHPIVQKYMLDYEKYLKDKITGVLTPYINKDDFIVSAAISWNKEGLKKFQKILFVDKYQDKIKLPGFKLYLEKQKETFDIISNSRQLLKQNITILLNNKINRKTAKFISGIIPISIKFYPERGDKLNILFDEFPANIQAENIEKPTENPDFIKPKKKDTRLDIKTSMILLEVRSYFYKNDLNSALEKVLEAIRLNPNSAKAYEMLGSIYFRLNWEGLAVTNWKKALGLNPKNEKLKEYIERVEEDQTAGN